MSLLTTSKSRSRANRDFRSNVRPVSLRRHGQSEIRFGVNLGPQDLYLRKNSYAIHLSIVRHNSRHGLSDTLDPPLSEHLNDVVPHD